MGFYDHGYLKLRSILINNDVAQKSTIFLVKLGPAK